MSPAPRLRARGKVRDVYDAGEDRLLARRHRSDQRIRRRAAGPGPGQGSGAHRPLVVLVRRARPTSPRTTCSRRPRRVPAAVRRRAGARRARDARAEGRRSSRWSASRAATCRVRDGRSTARRRRCAACRCPRASPSPAASRSRSSRPTTKADAGHDLPLDPEEAADLVGKGLFERLKELTLEIYQRLAETAAAEGILVADTKLEFGFADGELILIDEVGTPDSSRFWPADALRAGRRPALVRQAVRARLARRERVGPRAAAPDAPARRARGHGGALPGGVRADHRRAVRRLPYPRRGDAAARRRRGADDDAALERLRDGQA